MAVHCSTRATVVPYATSTMSKHQPWLGHDVFAAKPLKRRGYLNLEGPAER